jgi:hypothetical protein
MDYLHSTYNASCKIDRTLLQLHLVYYLPEVPQTKDIRVSSLRAKSILLRRSLRTTNSFIIHRCSFVHYFHILSTVTYIGPYILVVSLLSAQLICTVSFHWDDLNINRIICSTNNTDWSCCICKCEHSHTNHFAAPDSWECKCRRISVRLICAVSSGLDHVWHKPS